MKHNRRTENLRYLGAQSVRFSQGNLSGFRVCTEDAQPLGNVTGVLISPALRQLRYFVIQTPGVFSFREYLLPADVAGARLEEDQKTLRIDARKDELQLESFNARSVQEFSDSDLLEAIFTRA